TYTFGEILASNGEEKMPLDHVAPLFGRVGITYRTQPDRIRVEFYSLFNSRKPLSRYNLNGEDNIGYATVKGLDGDGLPAWFTLNLKASYRPHPNVTLQAGIENILDTEYRTFGSGISAPGRNLVAAIRASF
ncbi:MAG: TonB-dependent receptor, partial [Muribaculaceae bacterium]|nr:TonB-dependent receptor [Muribaculaceae bacterium]